ncbi:hypothetical protein BU23DRAFT_584901 [Bimuria novae-zelandiae CBS 107.79]|uniref:Zinc finger PHD-type domain-containing protein n=1 Tax=Bimuria novae-zelandiae CBS 107.79 TaxID=1447943 RepID=A0A6A5URV1_9PLEO|nr:hypothetical protein BU23DRAFT_584901 [Bimuria novae-zelandiae CBS 107.79]
MSPRRSSRARTTQPPPGVTAAHSTSSASTSSSRGDRTARAHHKQSSPHKSSTPHSLSSEELDEPPRDPQAEPPSTRRRTREHGNDADDFAKLDDDLDEDIAEEDEVTRCVCGQQEYPGPPSDAGKSKDGQLPSVTDSDLQGDDAGGLFIQCDICKVWQHGGCVGIMDEASSPDEYFCEECRKHLHKVMTSSKGQRYSRYLPVWDQHHHAKNARKGSLSKESEKPPREKDALSRASVESFSKRRSTMNSRAAYDEDEVLRKVLEESKHEGPVPPSENGNRKKRNRDDSEEAKSEVKRQRTGSRSPSGSPVLESDDESSKNAAPKQKPRGAAARSQREKEQREKEKERERAEAANRRKGRAERRKGDESEPPEAIPVEEPAMPEPTPARAAPAESPAVEPKPAPAPRKGGRPPQKRRLGRNQYTRDAPPPTANGASPAADETPNSPHVNGSGNGHDSSDGVTSGKTGKPKNWRLQKLSWHDIRRPAGAMQNYITQRQVEMAAEKPAPAVQAPSVMTNGVQKQEGTTVDEEDLDKFKNLNTLQMMDHLSRDLTLWQQLIVEANEK